MVHFSFTTDPVPILLFWINFWAWVAIWVSLVLRDRRFDVDVHTPSDQGSRTLIGISLWSGVGGAFLLAWTFPWAHMPGSGWPGFLSGILLMWAGIGLRVWAVRTLGRFFRTVVLIQDQHQLISTGPYGVIRHPSYAGTLLTLAGLGLALGNWLSLFVAIGGAFLGFHRRMQVEEAALHARFGTDYRVYAQQTWRLVPLLW